MMTDSFGCMYLCVQTTYSHLHEMSIARVPVKTVTRLFDISCLTLFQLLLFYLPLYSFNSILFLSFFFLFFLEIVACASAFLNSHPECSILQCDLLPNETIFICLVIQFMFTNNLTYMWRNRNRVLLIF